MAYENLTREQWLAIRRLNISSTESAALFGMSPYMTAYEVGVMKSDPTAPDMFTESERTVWGSRLQDAIAQGIADDYGVMIESCEYNYAKHPSCEKMGASFDYQIVGVPSNAPPTSINELYEEHGPGLLEIKNVDALVYRDWPEHDAPDHIEIQVQHQLEVAQLEWCVLGVLVGGNRTEIYTRMRDGTVGSAIASKVSNFWFNLGRGVLPPPVMPEDADLIIKLHQYAEPGRVFDGQADAELLEMCKLYAEASESVKKFADAQKVVKAEILKRIGDSERALVSGYNISASMVAAAEVKAYTRGGYRNFRITKKATK